MQSNVKEGGAVPNMIPDAGERSLPFDPVRAINLGTKKEDV